MITNYWGKPIRYSHKGIEWVIRDRYPAGFFAVPNPNRIFRRAEGDSIESLCRDIERGGSQYPKVIDEYFWFSGQASALIRYGYGFHSNSSRPVWLPVTCEAYRDLNHPENKPGKTRSFRVIVDSKDTAMNQIDLQDGCYCVPLMAIKLIEINGNLFSVDSTY